MRGSARSASSGAAPRTTCGTGARAPLDFDLFGFVLVISSSVVVDVAICFSGVCCSEEDDDWRRTRSRKAVRYVILLIHPCLLHLNFAR